MSQRPSRRGSRAWTAGEATRGHRGCVSTTLTAAAFTRSVREHLPTHVLKEPVSSGPAAAAPSIPGSQSPHGAGGPTAAQTVLPARYRHHPESLPQACGKRERRRERMEGPGQVLMSHVASATSQG